MAKEKKRTVFEKSYYKRFYINPETRAVDEADITLLVNHICSYLRYLRIPVKSTIDMGCGLGLWKRPLERQFPGIRYTGVDSSAELCKQYGWKRGSLTSYRATKQSDLVICQSVLQYLPAKEVRPAIANLHSLCKGAMYLEIVTREDWEENCDQTRTDGDIHLRSALWYRRIIEKHFTNCGGGLFIPEDSTTVLYELEHL